MRTIRSILENGPEMHSLPSSADLDAVAEEERIKRATAKNKTFPPQHVHEKNHAFQQMCRRGTFR